MEGSDAYHVFFESHHDAVKENPVELIFFAVGFFRLVFFSDEILEGLAQCPDE